VPEEAGQKTCEACGAGFHCGYAAGETTCWCATRPRVMTVDAAKECLCPKCLDLAIERAVKEQRRGSAARHREDNIIE